jgi:hypothetical protein
MCRFSLIIDLKTFASYLLIVYLSYLEIVIFFAVNISQKGNYRYAVQYNGSKALES